MGHTDRSTAWRDIWVRKGLDRNAPPHLADGYDLLSAEEYDRLVAQVLRPIGIRKKDSIFECGCGAGAFLASLLKVYPDVKVSGVDYSSTLLQRARERFGGDFFVGDMTELGFLPDGAYDHAMSFGSIYYLSSEEQARRAVNEMLRITRPGGTVYVGEVPDAAKKEIAEGIRRVSHQAVKRISDANPDHLYLPKALFGEVSRERDADVTIIDHTEFDLGGYQAAQYRYSVYIRKKG
jgi:ubiquinone/menaquinone biosynthesis C-methylase UbiE